MSVGLINFMSDFIPSKLQGLKQEKRYFCREGGDIGLFITLVPKVLYFFFLATLGTFIEF